MVSFWQIAIIVVLVVLLFGRGKISDLMGDVAKGIRSFKKGMSDDDAKAADQNAAPQAIDQTAIDQTAEDTVTRRDAAGHDTAPRA